jgi:hypothetical protein
MSPYGSAYRVSDNLRDVLTAPSFRSLLRQQLDRKYSSERPFRPSQSGTGLASPHHHTHRRWVSTSH